MKSPYEKARDQFIQQIEDFACGKRKKYPALLAEPLYVDSKLWGSESVHKRLTKAQRQEQLRYRQKIVDEYQTRWGLLCLMYGMDPVIPRYKAAWQELCRRLAVRHVPGLQTTNISPQPRKRRGAKRSRGPLYYIGLVHEVDEARARYAKTHKVKKVPPLTVIDNQKFLAGWKTASGKLQTAKTLLTRYRETKKMMEAVRERGPDPKFRPLAELAELYKNSKSD
jgi:hypothetical protein